MDRQKRVNGVSIRTFNYIMILLACALYGFLLYETVQVSRRYDALSRVTDDHIKCEKLATMVMAGSDTLTEQVRLFVVTGEISSAEAYFREAEVDRNREKGLEEMKSFHPNDAVVAYLEAALRHSNALMERECYAMRLTAEAMDIDVAQLPERLQTVELTAEDMALSKGEQRARAEDLVIGSGYRDAKTLIQDNVNYCLTAILDHTEQTRADSSKVLGHTIRMQRIFVTLMFVMTVTIFIFITVLIIRPLQIYIKCISDNRMLEIIGSYEFQYLALTYNDIYELNAANEVMLRKQAERDGLTELMNRASFDKLQMTLREYPIPVALMIIDVDKFKGVNDTYGHSVGDLVLKRVAKMLSESFRSSDFVARVGGDEFCVVMTEVDTTMRDSIRNKIADINGCLGESVDGIPPVSLSVGVAFSPKGFDAGLYKRADEALYKTKEAGRKGCSFYEE